MFDIIVIGAGPAGTAAAFDLLTYGFKVLLVDKYPFPRKKACAGGITPKGYHLFRYDISSQVKRQCHAVKITPPSRNSFLIKDEKTLCYMTKREELDFFSLKMVMDKGAVFKVIKTIYSIEEGKNSIQINTSGGKFSARFLIGADGSNSRVRQLTATPRFYQKQFALEADVMLERPDKFHMEFDFSRMKKGYYWIFPKDDHVNIGIYSVNPDDKPKIKELEDFAGQRLNSSRLDRIKGYPLCTGGYQYQPYSNRVLLAGDAAGLTERLFGEGIYFAVKSGQDAALSIFQCAQRQGLAIDLYLNKLKHIQADLSLHHYSAGWFYKFPWISLKALSVRPVNKPFAKGYAQGKTLSQILFGKLFVKHQSS